MAKSREEKEYERKFEKRGKGIGKSHGASGWIYCLGFIGAVVYYIQQPDTFWTGVIGVIKAIIWPAMLVYKVFTLLNM